MANVADGKLRLLRLLEILNAKTGENSVLSTTGLIAELEKFGFSVTRKTLYADIEVLREAGADIELKQGKSGGYYIASRTFELAELKLLVDAVQSSKFITAKKSGELISKVASLASEQDAGTLRRQVHVVGRIKAMNESIYYNVDTLHEAISQGKKIRFRYSEWAVDFGGHERFRREFRRDGEKYEVSPWALLWADENYYLVAIEEKDGPQRHYRVDKMDSIEITRKNRDGAEKMSRFDTAEYSKRVFGMFSGEVENVTLCVENRFAGVVADRFGREVFVTPDGAEHFTVHVSVVLSPQFYSWVTGLEGGAEIVSPENARRGLRELAERIAKKHGK